MKTLLMTVFTLFTMNAHASDAPFNNGVMKTLNNLCGDVWCEGDYQYNFNKLNCNFDAAPTFGKTKGACIVEFDMREQDSRKIKEKAVCVMVGYPNAAAVTGTSSNAYDPNLSDRFYEELSDCISAWESRAAGKL